MKILLIDDKTLRQQGFMQNIGIDLSDPKYNDILDNAVDQRYLEIYEQLKKDTLNYDDYSIIVAHKSAFDNNDAIITKLKNESKVLILFSGGIDANYYVKNDKNEILELNSKIFYSHNLKKFLENFKNNKITNILSLSYGDKWKLNIALNIVEEINYLLNETNDNVIDCDDLIDSLAKEILDEVDMELYIKINNDDTNRVDLICARKKILSYVDERLLYE